MTKGAVMNRWGRPVAFVAAGVAVLVACSDDGDSTKAGSGAPPVTLRIGTEDPPGRPTQDQIGEFARHVEELSEGQLRIEPVFRAGGANNADWDQVVGRMVVSGELDMGLIPARAWDTEGVTSLRALQAPFLVTSDELAEKVVTSELATRMLAGLDAVDLTGLALLPEGMRHLFVFGEGDVDLFDLEGKVVRAPTSATTSALFEAFGATADDLDAQDDRFLAGVRDGSVAAAESEFALAGCCLPAASAAAANLTLFPKVNSLIINTEAYEALSEDAQHVLREAADRTLDWAVAGMPSDAERAAAFCGGGGTIINAHESELAAMEAAVAPVYAELERDETTKELIESIRAIKATLPPPRPIAPCEPAATATTSPPEAALSLDGIWRQDVTYEYLVQAGLSEAMARQEAGVQTWTLEGGTFDLEYQDNQCSGTYEVAGDRVSIQFTSGCTGAVAMTATVEGGQITWSDAEGLPPYNSPDDQLIAEAFAGVPWVRVGDAPGAEPEFPDGVYRMEMTADFLIAAGVDRPTAVNHAGTWTLTFKDGTFLDSDDENPGCPGSTYTVEEGRVTIYMGDQPSCGTAAGEALFSAGWTLEDGQLQFTDVRSGHGSDVLIENLFGGQPFTKID
jgi:TRAP-type C4-dicarboxylate transport system substrate-binding protein